MLQRYELYNKGLGMQNKCRVGRGNYKKEFIEEVVKEQMCGIYFRKIWA